MGAGHNHSGHAHAGHDHAHGSGNFGRAFIIGIALNLAFVIVEVIYGFAANSMALLADAGHNLSDVLGLVVAYVGAILVKRRPSPRFSYGFKKSSILAALINALLLLVAVGGIIAEAIRRLIAPEPSNGTTVMAVAAVGIVINGVTALMFARGRHGDINIRGAYMHMMADAAVSAAVVVAGLLILLTGAQWIDPVVSLVVAAVILWGTWGLLLESTSMTLAGTPKNIESDQVARALEKLPGVVGTHHLHIWSLSTTETAMTVHLQVSDKVDRDLILRQANAYVHQLFGIDHSTIQVERAVERAAAIATIADLQASAFMYVTHLECSLTGERYDASQLHNLSRAAKPLLVRYDLDAVRAVLTSEVLADREPGMWKWRELLPLPEGAEAISLGEPETPLVTLDGIGRRHGVRAPLVKDEGRLPTGSFKARGLAMAVSMAKHFGVTRIAMPTNGNAGAALAAYGARAGIETIVICPAETPEINVTETAAYGAKVYVADGQIDECGALVGKGAAEGRWFDCSTLKEPYRIEGKKVMGLELAEQLGWQLPDAIFYPTGGGTGLIGMWKAFDELEAIGLIGSKRPRMYAIQAEGCAPMVRAFEAGEEFASRWEGAATLATGIRVPKAVGDFLILRAVRESGGAALAVSEEAILAGVRDAAEEDGFLLCPEAGAVLAGWRLALERGLVAGDEQVLLFNCANGNKYPLADRSQRIALAQVDAGEL